VNLSRLPSEARWLLHAQSLIRYLMGFLPLGIAVGGVIAWQFSMGLGIAVGAGLLIVGLLFAIWWPALEHGRWGWVVRERDLFVTHGVLFREVVVVPLSRIQHVDLRQGPVEQFMGLAGVQVYTASGMGADAAIPALRMQDAEALRDEILLKGGDDGV